VGGFGLHGLDVVLPLRISFFTFQKIAYLVDVHDGRAQPGRLLEFLIFVFFFPQLIAGPIVHHAEMMPQFRALGAAAPPDPAATWANLAIGGTVLLAGLFSKVVVADHLAPFATPVFDRARDGGAIGLLDAWQAALAYTGQLYFDFSGYSIMALGLGLLFGIRLPVNFNSPYQATSIIEFWRRWHITLSRFLRDYLYIPLGGNRKGPRRRYVNLMLVMVLGGLWHGAGWTFVIWGALHGACLLAAHLWRDNGAPRLPAWLGWFLTLLAVVVAWVFFRAASLPAALGILGAMAGLGDTIATPLYSPLGIGLSAALLAFAALAPNIQTVMRNQQIALDAGSAASRLPAWLAWRPSYPWAVVAGMGITAIVLSSSTRSEFLYFQF
jgi:D-alanyl-lipoteichoic acid acyltransferase DltB (MBOAT superfamily)